MWGGYMGYGPWGSGGWLMVLFMGLFWIALPAAFATLIWVVLRKGSPDAVHPGSASALRILQERYARGEIGKEEFEQKRGDLRR